MVVNIGNEKIHYIESGEGIPFVMLHGNMSSSVHFDILHENLVDGVRLITPDMRGFGDSTYNSEFDSLAELADDIIKFIKELGIDKCIIGGWSTGGGVAIEAVLKAPQLFEKLVLVESVGITGYPIYAKDENFQPVIDKPLLTKEEIAADAIQVLPILNAYETKDKEALKQIWNALIYVNNVPDEKRYDKYLDAMLKQRNLVDIDYALTRFNISDLSNGIVEGTNQCKDILLDTLILQGESDLVVPKVMGEGLESAIVNNTYVTGDWSHSPFSDKPDYICNLIFDFVRGK